jgi:hypothetical protein
VSYPILKKLWSRRYEVSGTGPRTGVDIGHVYGADMLIETVNPLDVSKAPTEKQQQ